MALHGAQGDDLGLVALPSQATGTDPDPGSQAGRYPAPRPRGILFGRNGGKVTFLRLLSVGHGELPAASTEVSEITEDAQ